MSRLYLISLFFSIVVLVLVWLVSPPESNTTVCSGESRQNVDQVLSQKTLAKMRFFSIFIQIWKFLPGSRNLVTRPGSATGMLSVLYTSPSINRITLSGILRGSQHKNVPIFD